MRTLFRFLLFSSVLFCTKAFAKTIEALTGNLSDVQSAINLANPGDTVAIPSGNFSWNGTLSITQSLILQGNGSNSTFISRATPITYTDELVAIDPGSDVPVRVTGINFNSSSIGQQYDRLPCISVWGPQGGNWGLTQIRIDNCYFTGGVDAVEWNYYAYGVVDSSTFHDCAYAIVAYSDGDYDWSRPIVYGSSNADYVEDCSFIMDSGISYFDTLTDQNRGGRLVMRYCNFDFSQFVGYEFGSIWMTHGNQAYWTGNPDSDNARAGIILELYNNSIIVNQGYRLAYLRGGRAVVYNNTFTCLNSSPQIVSMTEEEGYDNRWFSIFRTLWPAEDQVNNSFFWGNTINGQAQTADDFGIWQGPQDAIFIQQNRDYWLQPPNLTTVTIYPQPLPPSLPTYPVSIYYAPVISYTAFTYPHPLRSGASPDPTPVATPTPTATQPASPTPTPSATPTWHHHRFAQ